MIIDVSHHQPPSKIDYDMLANQVKFVIIRTQYGSNVIDRHYKTHHREFQKGGYLQRRTPSSEEKRLPT